MARYRKSEDKSMTACLDDTGKILFFVTVSDPMGDKFDVLDLNSIKDAENIEEIDGESFSVKYAGTDKLVHGKKLILPKNVKEIGSRLSFKEAIDFDEVVWPDNCSKIHPWAFSESNIKKLSNIDNVTEIGNNAFNECANLTEFTVPSGVSVLPESCFVSSGLKYIFIPDNVEVIERYCFEGSIIKKIEGMKNVKRIESHAFYDCSFLTSFNWPSKCLAIPEYCFSYCDSLTQVDGTDEVESIGPNAFFRCARLSKFKLPQKVKHIPNACFRETSIKDIGSLDSVLNIGPEAFKQCKNLRSVDLSRSICTAIENEAFSYCPSLKKVTLGYWTTHVDHSAFYGCDHEVELYNGPSKLTKCAKSPRL